MNSLAIIPARSGSKGLRNKNIKLLCGKPLIAYTIESALKSLCFDEVMVSTDSERYAAIALECGARVPFLRSVNTAGDYSSSWDAVLEVIDNYKKVGKEFSHICLLQPTSPIRDEDDIKAAFEELHRMKANAVVSICEMEYSPAICSTLSVNKSLENFISRKANIRRQNMEKYYRLNGAIYLVETKFLQEDSFLYRRGCYGVKMQQSHSIDIDTEQDFLVAQTILENRELFQENN